MWSGDGPMVTPETQRPTKRGQSPGSSTSTVRRSATGGPASTTSVGGKRSVAPVMAATSRASPTIERASPRFGFTSTSRTVSPYRAVSSAPSGVSAGQDEDPVGVDGQPELVAGAEHPVADDAHLLGALDAPVTGQDGPWQRDRDPLAGGDVRRPADDLERLPCPDVHRRQREPVGARVLLDGQQLADDDVAPVGAPRLDALDLHPEHRQALGEDLGGEVDVDVLAQPAERDPHRNCSRKRRSFSMYSRRSPTLWRRFEIRSTPIPNAKPW